MRKARIGNGGGSSKSNNNNNVDDWQSCWVDEAEDAREAIQWAIQTKLAAREFD